MRMKPRKTITKPSSSEIALAYNKCPAKTFFDEQGIAQQGYNVYQHCLIVGEVAKALLARMPYSLRLALFPEGAHLNAACHDIGKVSPTFARKLLVDACQYKLSDFPMLAKYPPDLEKNWGGHAGISQLALKAINPGDYIAEIAGQHHGYKPPIDTLRADDEVLGGLPWQQQREALINALKKELDSDWPVIESFVQARVIAGLTSVSDWIGSGFFFEIPVDDWHHKVALALDNAGFVPAKVKKNITFQQTFGFEPRPVQQQLIAVADKPGVYILEAPMGLGKTEAALYAAYQRLETGQASGIYFALPTQLTSNKIYERFNFFLKAILEDSCPHKQSLLLHGNAWLYETEMGEDGCPGGSWFNSNKRGLLAPFAVGTLDQALMAVMNVKHGFVRAFGLAGKVVILDEVHTYDAYTGTIMDALVDGLRKLQCTVIILSATLNFSRRQKLLNTELNCQAYPLITASPTNFPQKPQEIAIDLPDTHNVKVTLTKDDLTAVEEALKRAEQGQQILWIENTVAGAQKRYLDFAARCAELGIACGLLHSRFTAEQRQIYEDHWVNLYGKQGWSERAKQGRILIGTQVLEQSLDIDADFLVSAFAPTDMLLQRLGRLWRHANTPRNANAVCEAYFLAPDLELAINQPKTAFAASFWVYSPYVLCRSLEVWQQKKQVCLPRDIRDLIEATYKERNEEGNMALWLYELEHGTRHTTGKRALQQSARITLAQNNKTLPENKAQTRYNESDNLDVLLLKKLVLIPEKQLSLLVLLNDDVVELPWRRHRLSKKQWRQLSVRLYRQLLHIREGQEPQKIERSILQKTGLQHCFYLGNPEYDEAILRVALVDASGDLHGYQGNPVNSQYHLSYRDNLGYRIEKQTG